MATSGFVENPVAQLEKVSAAGRDLTIQGQIVTVSPLKFMALIKAIKHLNPIFEMVKATEAKGGKEAEIDLVQLMETIPHALIEITKLCTGKTDAWFETLESDEGLEVIGAVLEVNKDFFVQRLVPQLSSLKDRMGSALPPAAPKVGLNALTTS